MKKISLYILVFFTIFSTSCHDELDLDPTDKVIEEEVWNNKEAMDLYVVGFYALLRDAAEIRGNLTDGYSDILKYTGYLSTNHNRVLLDVNHITRDANPLSTWGNYDRIRRHNEFLYLAPKRSKAYTDEELEVRMAEVRFIRAFAYYQMVRVHGGVILRDEHMGADSEAQKDKARATEEESWDFIMHDLKYAAEKLPTEWPTEWEGRITKGAAYALLTRCGVYAKKWKEVIVAYNNIEALGIYGLNDNYASIFTNRDHRTNKEAILTTYFKKPDYIHSFDKGYLPKGDKSSLGAMAVPTGELVDKYEMSNGTDFDWGTHGANPYVGREPRFYASVLYHGADWKGRKIAVDEKGADAAATFTNSNQAPNATVTGYYIKKYLDEHNLDFQEGGSDQPWVVIRYAEVLLNYAEALAELDYGAHAAKAKKAVNTVRDRVSLPARPVANKAQFMQQLRKERMIELAFEGHRYWDLRRWELAESIIGEQQAHGVKVVKQANGTFTYEHITCDADMNRFFPKKYYKLPIPKSETDNNLLCKQNPLW